MSNVTQERRQLVDLESVKFITGALRDISAIELKHLREEFNRNDRFYQDMRKLYHVVGSIAEQEGLPRVHTRTGPTLYVAFTSNRHFYGSLNNDVMRRLVENTNNQDRCLVVGETGKTYWKRAGRRRKEVEFVQFRDDSPTLGETHEFLEYVNSYSRVFVFYPGFVSVFKQEARMLDITYREEKSDEFSDSLDMKYILEPEIVDMFFFFEMQVRYVLFERILLETELARIAARLMKMDNADENATNLIKTQRVQVRRAMATFSSIRLLETFTGYLQWNRLEKEHA